MIKANKFKKEQDAIGACTGCGCWSVVVDNCECGGIVRNDLFPDTLPYKYPYFSPFA